MEELHNPSKQWLDQGGQPTAQWLFHLAPLEQMFNACLLQYQCFPVGGALQIL